MGRPRRLARRIDLWDVKVSRAVARHDSPAAMDVAIPLLTRCADKSVLWATASAGLLASGRPTLRRAAVRGLASIAVTSLVANQGGKRLLRRQRPSLVEFPMRRIAHRVPASSSFPSGHSASAAAFAVAVAVEQPWLAVPVGAVAAAVAFSRVYTGVHYPSDLLAGVALGAGIATLGAVAVPAHHHEVRRAGGEPTAAQPSRPTGRGVVAVVNPLSGPGRSDTLPDEIRALLPDAEVVELGEDVDIAAIMDDAAGRAEVLAVAGGDGTVNCAAQAAMRHDRPLLVLPAGTFNHFAKDLDLTELTAAQEALAQGRAVRVDVGTVDDHVFLNTASLGHYPEFVAARERWEDRLGKPLAAVVALATVARRCPPLEVEVDGVRRRLLVLFVGSNAYTPKGFMPRGRRALDTGVLDVRLLDERHGGSPTAVLAGALGLDLRRRSGYHESRAPQLTVRVVDEPTRLACDGEVFDAPATVRFAMRRAALTVYRGIPGS
ncbi:MAG: bifunctional phosphatase PAP2/diacylglycerol kinase family protein [Jatrophihabitans sp.]|uniref:bifunctional phosphatase PAP2/diacylglycerol kinase family protein n=1 Tax=Jatrophihabitans sp. TaxID=1932789 RepID=UPI003F7F4B17